MQKNFDMNLMINKILIKSDLWSLWAIFKFIFWNNDSCKKNLPILTIYDSIVDVIDRGS